MEKGALVIFERSFRENFPKLCKGRKVIICDHSIIKDPCDDRYLRGHTGRQYKTVEKLVDHKDFVGLNMPLQDIDDQPVLIIDACVHGRRDIVQLQTRKSSLSYSSTEDAANRKVT